MADECLAVASEHVDDRHLNHRVAARLLAQGGAGHGAANWWLRAPGMRASSAAYADFYGLFYTWGALVNCDGGTTIPGVRPAMWIDLGT